MTLDDLRAQAMDDLTPEQLRAASDAVLKATGWIDCLDHENELYWEDPQGNRVEWHDAPNPAADLTDAAALMPDGYRIFIETGNNRTNIDLWTDPPTVNNEWPAELVGEVVARREPYARMLAAVAAHLEANR